MRVADPRRFRTFSWENLAITGVIALGISGALAALSLEASARGGSTLGHNDFPVLAVHIENTGFTVLGAAPALPASDAHIPCPGGLCKGPGSYNFSVLRARLARVKRADPALQTILLLPEADTPLTVIYATMAASTSNPLDPDAEGRPEMLFPDVRVAPPPQESLGGARRL